MYFTVDVTVIFKKLWKRVSGFLHSGTSRWQTVLGPHTTEKSLQPPHCALVWRWAEGIPGTRGLGELLPAPLSQTAPAGCVPSQWRRKPRKCPGVRDTGPRGGGEGGETERGREGGRRRECWGTGLKRDLKMISRPRKQALQIGADQKTWRYFFKKINLIQYLTCINILKVVYNQERVGVQLIMKIKQM